MLVMKAETSRRPYAMRARAEAAERLSEQIIDAAYELWLERAYDEITLQQIADRAGVSVSSVMRRFGAKEGVGESIITTHRLGEKPPRDNRTAGERRGGDAPPHPRPQAGGGRPAPHHTP